MNKADKENSAIELEDIQKQILELLQKTSPTEKYDHPPSTFDPPKLPYKWLATTFIAPALIVFLPYVFNFGEESMQTLVSVALALAFVLSLATLLMTHTRLYDAFYRAQVNEYRIAELSKIAEETRLKNTEAINIVYKSYEAISNRYEKLSIDSTTEQDINT